MCSYVVSPKSLEQLTTNLGVAGSNPAERATFCLTRRHLNDGAPPGRAVRPATQSRRLQHSNIHRPERATGLLSLMGAVGCAELQPSPRQTHINKFALFL